MSPYSIPPLVGSIFSIFIGSVVLSKNIRSQNNLSFFLFCLSLFVWLFGYTVAYSVKDAATALFFCRVACTGACFTAPAFYHFSVSFLEVHKERRLAWLSYLVMAFIAPFSMASPYFLSGTWDYHWGYYSKAGLLHPVYLVIFFGMFGRGFYLLYKAIRKQGTGVRKLQLRYVFIAYVIALLGAIDYIPKYGVEFYPFGFIFEILFSSIVAYSIVRYRLLDITVAVTRTAVFTGVYTLLLGLPLLGAVTWRAQIENLFGSWWWVGFWLLGVVLATAANAVNLLFRRKAEARLLREQRRYQTMLLHAAKGMTEIRDLGRLLKLLSRLLLRAMKLTHVGIFLWDDTREQYVQQVQVRPSQKASPSSAACDTHDSLILWLMQERAPVVREEISQLVDTKRSRTVSLPRLQTRLKNLDAAVVVPSFVNDRLIGFLVLGNKRSGTMYSEDDLNMLQTMANQTALAIENAQFYKKDREHQAELFHASSIADLGTMASSMSHLLNNPFCIISGTAQTREEQLRYLLRNGSALSESVRQLLQAELESLQSIQEETTKGSNIIASMRGITTPHDPFRPMRLTESVSVALPVVKHKIPFDQFDFRQEFPADLPRIWGSCSQLSQCLLNLIENAWDAIQLKEQRLNKQHSGYKGLICLAISTTSETDPATKKMTPWVVLSLSDNGMGIKPEDLRKLFIPFYTTKATAEKGNGIGLYIIRKIIEGHGGTISVDSTYGTGTIFKIRLPALTEEEIGQRIAQMQSSGNGLNVGQKVGGFPNA